MESMKGLTFMIVMGKWAKPKLYLGKGGSYGLCAGWISVQFIKYDMECWVFNAIKRITDLQEEISKK